MVCRSHWHVTKAAATYARPQNVGGIPISRDVVRSVQPRDSARSRARRAAVGAPAAPPPPALRVENLSPEFMQSWVSRISNQTALHCHVPERLQAVWNCVARRDTGALITKSSG